MSTTNHLVSVIIPTFDRNELIIEAIESVLAQSYRPFEVIVVDDGSKIPLTQSLPQRLQSHPEIAIYRHETNQGANAARNTGLELATGTYIAFLDDDDLWKSDKLERQVAQFREASQNVGVVYTGREVETAQIPTLEGDVLKPLLLENFIGTQSTVMVREKAIEQSGTFDERFPSWTSWEWFVRLAQDWGFRSVPHPLAIHRVSSHEQLSDDYWVKKEISAPRFLEKYRPVAAEFGKLFERRMVAGVKKYLAKNAVYNGLHGEARRVLMQSIRCYPFDIEAYGYLAAVAGGDLTFSLAKRYGVYRAYERLFD